MPGPDRPRHGVTGWIEDFRGVLAGWHDRLMFDGFGPGAGLVPSGGGDWQIIGGAGYIFA